MDYSHVMLFLEFRRLCLFPKSIAQEKCMGQRILQIFGNLTRTAWHSTLVTTTRDYPMTQVALSDEETYIQVLEIGSTGTSPGAVSKTLWDFYSFAAKFLDGFD